MTGYRKMIVALLGMIAVVALAIVGKLDTASASAIGGAVGAFCGANLFEHRG